MAVIHGFSKKYNFMYDVIHRTLKHWNNQLIYDSSCCWGDLQVGKKVKKGVVYIQIGTARGELKQIKESSIAGSKKSSKRMN